jgi:hypothetical protein
LRIYPQSPRQNKGIDLILDDSKNGTVMLVGALTALGTDFKIDGAMP